MLDRYTWLPGALLFVGAVQFGLLLNISTGLYPGYDVNHNYISDLGATCRASGCIVQQPSSLIFNSSAFVFGLLGTIGFYLFGLQSGNRLFSLLGVISSTGAMGVGVFTEESSMLHTSSALLAFGVGGLMAILAYRVAKFPFSLFSVAMGGLAIVFLIFLGLFIDLSSGGLTSGTMRTVAGLGFGLVERLVAHAILLWILGLGGYLMNSPLRKPQA